MADPHIISVTGKVFKESRVLIVRRSLEEKNYPGRWIVPGGKLDYADYQHLEPNSDGLWYHVIEKALKREIKEETSLEVENVQFLMDMVFPRKMGLPTLVIACTCDYVSGEVKLNPEVLDYAWVTLEEAKNYDLIDGVYEELKLAFNNHHAVGFEK